MPRDYFQSSLFRVKAKVDGMWVDDPDIANTAITLPNALLSDDPTTRLAWRMPNRRPGSKVKIKVTFRRDDGLEVAGSYTAYAFVYVPLCDEEKALDANARPAIEKNPPAVNGTSPEPMILDELGLNDIFGLVFSSISAGDATRMFVRMEEVD